MVEQIDRKIQIQSTTAVSLLDVQRVDIHPLIVSPGMAKCNCCSSILNY